MIYEMMVPPFETVRFDEMNKKQAQEYFDWYMSQIDIRISTLLNAVKIDGGNYDFDYSVDSLIPIWKWYENKIQFRKLDESEYESQILRYPEWMKTYISDKDLSFETLTYCTDVSIYFAEVIIRNNNGKIKWGYFTKPKNRFSVNEPVLLGFKDNDDLNPRLIVENCTRKSAKEKMDDRLLKIYNTWMKYII